MSFPTVLLQYCMLLVTLHVSLLMTINACTKADYIYVLLRYIDHTSEDHDPN